MKFQVLQNEVQLVAVCSNCMVSAAAWMAPLQQSSKTDNAIMCLFAVKPLDLSMHVQLQAQLVQWP